ncbi:Protein of unknown function DUF1180 [Trinorchestia longiramus]|nr:Protein of unknown function DUF1180 [Trinorchestia longiramus]
MSDQDYYWRPCTPFLVTLWCVLLCPAMMVAPAALAPHSDTPGVGSSSEHLVNALNFGANSETSTKEDIKAGVPVPAIIDGAESAGSAAGVGGAKATGGAVDDNSMLAANDADASNDARHSFSSDISSNSDENEKNSIEEYTVAIRTFNTGAVWRGFLVFVGCSLLVVLYFGVRTACRRRGRRQRKYHKVDRGDELDVFPLTEADDDDEEIFSADVQR